MGSISGMTHNLVRDVLKITGAIDSYMEDPERENRKIWHASKKSKSCFVIGTPGQKEDLS